MHDTSRGFWILALTLGLAAAIPASGQTTIDYDSAQAAVGRGTYKSFCASCHGKEAKGDGPVAKYMDVQPADLTGIAARNGGEFPDEFVREMIDGRVQGVRGHGSKEMPIWGDAFEKLDDVEGEDDVKGKIEALAHFLRSIQK